MRFRLVPKSSTLGDLEWLWTAKMHFFAEKMRLLEPTAQIIKIDPYNLRQKCSPMILVSGNGKSMVCGDIRGGSTWWRRQMRVGWSTTAIFGHLNGYFFRIFRDRLRCAILYDDMLTLVSRQMTAKKNDLEWLWVAICRENPFLASTLLQ